VVEGTICATYQLCCRDPALDVLDGFSTNSAAAPVDSGSGAATGRFNQSGGALSACISAPEGALTDLAATLNDPSSTKFCPYVTGAPAHLIVAPPAGVCTVLGRIADGFSTQQCQAEFCESGVDAYLAFVNVMIELLQSYAVPLAAVMGSMVVLLIIFACNVRQVSKLKPVEKEKGPRFSSTMVVGGSGTRRRSTNEYGTEYEMGV